MKNAGRPLATPPATLPRVAPSDVEEAARGQTNVLVLKVSKRDGSDSGITNDLGERKIRVAVNAGSGVCLSGGRSLFLGQHGLHRV